MSIGGSLADARRRAGLSVAQVSEVTCIRETVVHAIERGDFSVCGGNFYARGHIRSIARTVGTDPEPLVAQFDDAHGGSPQTVRASEVFEPETPIKFGDRRRPNWSAAMAVALALLVGYAVFRVFTAGPEDAATQVATTPRATPNTPPVHTSPSASPSPSQSAEPVAKAPRDEVVVSLRAVANCWVNVRDSAGDEVFEGLLREGDEKEWTDKKRLRVVIGNAGGAALTVNGEDLGKPGGPGEVVRVDFEPGDPDRG